MKAAPAILRHRLIAVDTAAELDRFIKVPWRVYRDDPHWTPPLVLERRQLLSKKRNPYFQHAEAQYFLILKDDEPVGRISAQVDQLVQTHMGQGTGQFGFYDVIDDFGLSTELFNRAEDWLRSRGMNRALGPFSLSINEETGLLIDGFDMPPCVMMGHARPYMRDHLERLHYQKAIDTYAYWLDVTARDPGDHIVKLLQWAWKNPRFKMRPLDKRNFRADIDIVLDIFNDAWSDNWGFIPMTPAEIDKMASDLRPVIFNHMNRICEYDGEPIAFMITLPDINRLIRDLDGRLLPFGWAKLVTRLLRQRFQTVRVPLMGVKKSYQRSRVGAAAAFMLIESIRANVMMHGGEYAELSWILEGNSSMRNILEQIDSRIYKTYRIFEKNL